MQNYYCPLMCTLYLRNRYGDLDYDPVEYDGEYAAKYEDEIRDLLIREQSDCNMAEYFDGPNSAVGKLESAVWDVERIHGCLYRKLKWPKKRSTSSSASIGDSLRNDSEPNRKRYR